MRTISLFAFFAFLLINASANDLYYHSFIETLGIEAHITEDGKDCNQPVASAVYDFQSALVNRHKDNDALYSAVSDIVDKLKFEVSPQCRTFLGDFEGFMTQYFGDAEDLRDLAEQNLDVFSSEIESAISQSGAQLDAGEDYLAGKTHATILRYFIGLEKKIVSMTQEETQEVPSSAPETPVPTSEESSNQVNTGSEVNDKDTVITSQTSSDDSIVEVVGVYIEDSVNSNNAQNDEVLAASVDDPSHVNDDSVMILDISGEPISADFDGQGDEYVDEIVNDILAAVDTEENLSSTIVLTIDATTEQVAIHTLDVDINEYADEIDGNVVGVIGIDEELNGAVIVTLDNTNEEPASENYDANADEYDEGCGDEIVDSDADTNANADENDEGCGDEIVDSDADTNPNVDENDGGCGDEIVDADDDVDADANADENDEGCGDEIVDSDADTNTNADENDGGCGDEIVDADADADADGYNERYDDEIVDGEPDPYYADQYYDDEEYRSAVERRMLSERYTSLEL